MKLHDDFPLYPEKFLSSPDVQLMSMREFGTYCKILFASWLQERRCYMENDEEKLRRLCGLEKSEWLEIWPVVGKKFKTEGDHIYNETLLEIWHSQSKTKKESKKKQLSMITGLLNYTWDEFWNDYGKKVGNQDRLIPKWIKLSDADREAIKEYLPKYKEAKPDKQYRLNPETFLNQRGWEHELIYTNKKSKNNLGDYGAEKRVGI